MKKDNFIKKIIGFLFTISGMGWWVKKLPKHMPYKEYSKTVAIDMALIGNLGVIPAPAAGEFIVIDFISVIFSGDNVVTFRDNSNLITGPMPFKAGQSLTWENTNHDTMGIMTCAAGLEFLITSTTAEKITGMLRYRVVGN